MQASSRPLLIGITGNIGSGKSTFCRFLTELGIKVYYADTIAHQLLEDQVVVRAISQRYPSVIIANNPPSDSALPTINRKKLAEIVFSQEQEVEYLNSLLHPMVLRNMQKIVEQQCNDTNPYLCFEVPLLIEADLQNCFDYIVLITAPQAVRLQRLTERGEAIETARQRMHNQLEDKHKLDIVDYIVSNNGAYETLVEAAQTLVRLLPGIAKRNISLFFPES